MLFLINEKYCRTIVLGLCLKKCCLCSAKKEKSNSELQKELGNHKIRGPDIVFDMYKLGHGKRNRTTYAGMEMKMWFVDLASYLGNKRTRARVPSCCLPILACDLS